jgi:pilus assembly protein CpaF
LFDAQKQSEQVSPPPPVDVPGPQRRKIHRMLLEYLDLASFDRAEAVESIMRPRVVRALDRIVQQLADELPETVSHQRFIEEMADEALGLGPLQSLLLDEQVSEIMVVDPQTIYVEKQGKIFETRLRFTDDDACRAVIERIVTPLGRRIDESSPLVDARLPDGSRVNAVIPPLAVRGPCITIRKFPSAGLSMAELVGYGSLDERMGRFLERCVRARRNIVISGGTGSGKTTLLNVLSASIAQDERVVTIEDAAELRLAQPHVVSLESKPPNLEGRGAYSIRDLLRNALRMRPDRIVVGECRAGEAIDMLQAMNTGHEGSMTTTHANSPVEAVKRLETLCLMSGLDLPSRAVREQMVASIDLIVQQSRFSDGSRRVTAITELLGLDEHGDFVLHDIFSFRPSETSEGSAVQGEFEASGYLPSFIGDFATKGLLSRGDFL